MKHIHKWFLLKSALITIALLTTSCSDASSGCGKEETLKLIGAGYTKAEISNLCSNDSGPSNKILGIWKEPQGEMTFEFLDDGTLLIGSIKGRKKMSGKWSILKDGRLKIEIPSGWGASQVRIQEYKFEGDQLIFMGESGETDRLDRLTDSGGVTPDSATDATRFSVSDDDVISDSQTGLDWRVGPNKNTDYNSAKQWITSLVASDSASRSDMENLMAKDGNTNWRMPTLQELESLYQKSFGKPNITPSIDPSFGMTGWFVWTEPRDSSSAWFFDFNGGVKSWDLRDWSDGARVFAVRSNIPKT